MQKTVIITGANTGLGKATAMELAGNGCCVIMGCRDKEKARAVQKEIIEKTGNKNIDLLLIDLASQDSIRKFVHNVKTNYSNIDVLINNAGISMEEQKFTTQGVVLTFAVNHLGPFLLTYLLLDLLKKSAPSRIVMVASSIEKYAKLNLNDLNLKFSWNGYLAYANSKLCNIYYTYELAGRLKGTGITANCLSPGLVNSDLFRNYEKLPWFFKVIKKLIGKTPEQGAETSVYLALSSEVENVSGRYFDNCKQKETSRISYDKDIAAKLWEISRELCGIKQAF